MAVEFIDSETLKVSDEKMIYFMHPHVLVRQIIETISSIGAEKIFSSPDENIKKVRESFAEYFFALALKKATGLDWFLMQPKDDPPDFELMAIGNNPITITLIPFELVEIPIHCQTSEEMMKIVRNKQRKGYSGTYNLLIFINNEKSSEWVSILYRQLKDRFPFREIWTIYLLQYKNTKNLYGVMVNKLLPSPVTSIKFALNDNSLRYYSQLPSYMEEMKIGGKTLIKFKDDFTKELTIKLRKAILARSRKE